MSKTPQEQDAQFAAKIDADVSVEKIAGVYAEALLGAVREKKESADAILEELDSLLTDVFPAVPKFEEVLFSATVSHEEKVSLLDRTLGQQASLTFLHFLKVLSRHGRMEILRAVSRQSHVLNDRQKGRIPVTVTTAAEMEESAFSQLAERLRAKLGGEPIIHSVIDPDVVGGIVVRVGDTIYDASIATQLRNVRQNMIVRSAHEIQSRRDRFRNTEGN
ncbi:MAG: ATP synthase F1 subunit delta [Planctomycetaceae bacterium]|jgi:F-type H+-transporting ATPase subunit delta|nr:ATP synthase F1 subunit delta [Planctomycetaceae bacterium]